MTEWLSALAWGDVPTWLASLGGIGALIAASIAAKASLNVLKIESQRDQDADERAQRAQADLVAAWLVHDGDGLDDWAIQIQNDSNVPVYFFNAEIWGGLYISEVLGRTGMLVLPPGSVTVRVPELRYWATRHLPPDALDECTPNEVLNSFFVGITFRDAAGVTWRRSETGVLNRLNDEGPDMQFSPTNGVEGPSDEEME